MTTTPALPAPATETGGFETITLGDALILHRVTDRAWQVCDSRHLPHHPAYLLGFVEQVGAGVELMVLGNKFIWTGFPSMRAALDHLTVAALPGA